MHAFFRAPDVALFITARESVAKLAPLPDFRGRGEPADVWFQLALFAPCVHPTLACPVHAVPIVPDALLPIELGIDGRPRESRIASAIALLRRRNTEVMLMLRHYPTLAETHVGAQRRENLQAALSRYFGAALGKEVSGALPPRAQEDDDDYFVEQDDHFVEEHAAPVPASCLFDGTDVLVAWSDGAWTRTGASGTSPTAARPRPSLFDVQESSVLRSSDGRLHPLTQVGDYPVVAAPSPNGALLWVADKGGLGGVFDVETGLLAAAARRPTEPVRTLARDGAIQELTTEYEIEDAFDAAYDAQRALETGYRGALGVSPGEEGNVELHFFDGVTPQGTLILFPSFATAFDAKAERLALVDRHDIHVLRVADNVIEHRYPLAREIVLP